jgi:methanogenic corrinoid protein MtbC1
VEWLKARLEEGYRIGEAAALLGSGEAVALSPEHLRAAIVEAALGSDVVALARLVDQALALPSLEESFVDVLAPALREIGEQWQAGELTVAQEHLATGTIRAALQTLIADARASVRGTAVLACAPGEHHEIGLLMLAVLLRGDGWQVAYLGADTPLRDAVSFAEELDARIVCFSAATREHADRLARSLAHERVPEQIEVVVGGRATGGLDVRSAVRALRRRGA